MCVVGLSLSHHGHRHHGDVVQQLVAIHWGDCEAGQQLNWSMGGCSGVSASRTANTPTTPSPLAPMQCLFITSEHIIV